MQPHVNNSGTRTCEHATAFITISRRYLHYTFHIQYISTTAVYISTSTTLSNNTEQQGKVWILTGSPWSRNFHIELDWVHTKYCMTNVTQYVTCWHNLYSTIGMCRWNVKYNKKAQLMQGLRATAVHVWRPIGTHPLSNVSRHLGL